MSSFGALIADRNRASLLVELLDGRRMPASELASRVGISRSLASSHLAKLERSGVLAVERRGRNRFYTLSGPELAELIERLNAMAPPPAAPRNLRSQSLRQSLAYARSCYDHLAGTLGVQVGRELERQKLLRRANGTYKPASALLSRLQAMGVEVAIPAHSRRPLARPCLDWTERRDHVAGIVGQAILDAFLEQGWLVRTATSRGLAVTDPGANALREQWNITVPHLHDHAFEP